MDKQTIHLITLIVAIIGSNAWSHANLSASISPVSSVKGCSALTCPGSSNRVSLRDRHLYTGGQEGTRGWT